jgi:hypothetical protein
MALTIIKGTEPIPVEHPIFALFGRPGIAKTSLGYSAPRPLLLDFDGGAHRAVNRRDTLRITSWDDVAELLATPEAIEPYDTFVVDTVGRALDIITADIAKTEPKKAPGGVLSLQGYGTLKTRFRQWMATLRSHGKDVVLLAHDREEKDGDSMIVRPDIIGASLGEVMRVADFVGYLYMSGKDRVLDFSPTDRWVGKNPGQWAPFKVPAADKAQTFMTDLMAKGREALGQVSAESAKVFEQVEAYREALKAMTAPEEFTAAIPEVKKLAPMASAQIARLLHERATDLGFTFDKKIGGYVAPATVGATA